METELSQPTQTSLARRAATWAPLAAELVVLPIAIGALRASARRKPLRPLARQALGVAAIGATAIGAFSLGALAVGALSIGALAVGRLAMRRVAVGDLRVRSLTIDELHTPSSSAGASQPSEGG